LFNTKLLNMFNQLFKKIGLTRKINREEFKKFLANYQSDGLTLDIGAGFSPYDEYYKHNFPNRTVLDIAQGHKVDVVGDVHKMEFEDNKFDTILCLEVFEHLKNPFLAAQEIERVLKPGGQLILTTRFIAPIHDAPGDYFRFTKYGLQELFKNFDIKVLRAELGTILTLSFLYQRLGFQTKTKILKLVFFIKSKLISYFAKIKLKEFGDIKQTTPEENIISSGYYLVAHKK